MQSTTTLWDHQREALSRIAERAYFALFFEMGTGKTLTAIHAYLQKCEQHKRILVLLILCPAIVVEAWYRAFVAETPEKVWRRVRKLEGSGRERIDILHDPDARVFITNTEAASMHDFWKAIYRQTFDALIIDESHRFKKPNGVRAKNLHALADTVRFKWILTGSPVLQSLLDIWSQFRILDKRLVGENFYEWRARHFYDENAGKKWLGFSSWVPKPDAAHRIGVMMAEHSMRVLKSEVLDLPPLVRQSVFVDLPPKLAKHYREMERDFLTEIHDDVCEAEIVLTKLLRLQQITCGLLPTSDGAVVREQCAKLTALSEIVDDLEPQTKVIVWANFIAALDDIELVMKALGRYHVSIRGGQTPKERQEAVDKFQSDPKTTVCVANQAAGGTGIGLQAASVMIYYSKAFHLEHDIQSESRAHRGGSEQHTSITRIDIVTRGTVEEQITDALRDKKALGDLLFAIRRDRP